MDAVEIFSHVCFVSVIASGFVFVIVIVMKLNLTMAIFVHISLSEAWFRRKQ